MFEFVGIPAVVGHASAMVSGRMLVGILAQDHEFCRMLPRSAESLVRMLLIVEAQTLGQCLFSSSRTYFLVSPLRRQ